MFNPTGLHNIITAVENDENLDDITKTVIYTDFMALLNTQITHTVLNSTELDNCVKILKRLHELIENKSIDNLEDSCLD
jgi:hypothetical protein